MPYLDPMGYLKDHIIANLQIHFAMCTSTRKKYACHAWIEKRTKIEAQTFSLARNKTGLIPKLGVYLLGDDSKFMDFFLFFLLVNVNRGTCTFQKCSGGFLDCDSFGVTFWSHATFFLQPGWCKSYYC